MNVYWSQIHSLELAGTRSSLIVVGGSFVGLFSWGVWPSELTSGDGPTYEPSIFGGMPNGWGSQWLRNTEIASSNSFSSNFVCCWRDTKKRNKQKEHNQFHSFMFFDVQLYRFSWNSLNIITKHQLGKIQQYWMNKGITQRFSSSNHKFTVSLITVSRIN